MPAVTVTGGEPQLITLINPDTGVRFQYKGRWLRSNPATDRDVKLGFAKFRGDKVYLPLPPGVQAQLDKGVLQVARDFEAREALEASAGIHGEAPPQPAGNASRETWIAYAVSEGMPREEAVSLSRDEIRRRFTAPAFDPDAAPDLALLNDAP